MSSTSPPRIKIPFSGGQQWKEFVLHPTKTVEELSQEIRTESPSTAPVSLVSVGGETVDPALPLQKIVDHSFHIKYEKTDLRVYPSVLQMLEGHESYEQICEDIGLCHTDAISICRYIDDMEKELPDTFDAETLAKVNQHVLGHQQRYVAADLQKLEEAKGKLERELEPLENQVTVIRKAADRFAARILKLGFGVIAGQLTFFAVTTFHVYGWDTMEPITFLFQAGWIVAGYSYFLVNKADYSDQGLRETLDKNYVDRKFRKHGVDLAHIDLLKKQISEIQDQINRIR